MWGSRSAFASVGLRAAEGLALLVAVSIALVLPGQLETSGPPKPATSPLHRLTPSTITVAASPSPAQPRKQRLAVSHRPPGRVSQAPAAAALVSGRPDHHNTGTNPAAGPTEPGTAAPPAQTHPTPPVTAPAPSSPTASPPPTTTTPPTTAGAGPSNPVPPEPQASTPTDRPGWGHGDTNHPHTGPPGQPPPTTTVQAGDVETQAQPGNGQNAADDSPARRGRG
jgi:hypothetical protein